MKWLSNGRLVENEEQITPRFEIWKLHHVQTFIGGCFVNNEHNGSIYLGTVVSYDDVAAHSCYDHMEWLVRNSNETVKRVRSESDKKSLVMRNTMKIIGIDYTTTSAYNAESNTSAKRLSRILLDNLTLQHHSAWPTDAIYDEKCPNVLLLSS